MLRLLDSAHVPQPALELGLNSAFLQVSLLHGTLPAVYGLGHFLLWPVSLVRALPFYLQPLGDVIPF
jgi:hypothetical protein